MLATAEFTVHLKPLDSHPKQRQFVESTAKRKIVRAGRRAGKTTGAGILGTRRFLEGHRVLYAAPTAEQLGKFWREVVKALAEPIDAGVFRKNETEHIIELLGTEQRIRAKTAWNADTLRGDYADLLILDEWQLMDETAWTEVGAPMLLDNNGDAVFIYTPPSLRSRSVSKAKDPKTAAKMFVRAVEEARAAAEKNQTPRWAAFHFTSHDNPHISEIALAEITRDMTQLAIKQEILAEDTEDVPGALWKQGTIDDARVVNLPELARIVVAVDPSATSHETSDECGIVAAGLGVDGHGYVLRDASKIDTPKGWGTRAVTLYHELKADRIVAEENNGGEMVELTMRIVDDKVSYKGVHASRGKATRAEPISALYEKGLVHHVGLFPALEEELTSWVPGASSPNRLDALVWAFTELMIGPGMLGLVEYLKSGAAERDIKLMNNVVKVAGATTLAKPMIASQADECPECKSKLIGPIAGGQARCRECGVQWWPKGAPRAPYATRGAALEKVR